MRHLGLLPLFIAALSIPIAAQAQTTKPSAPVKHIPTGTSTPPIPVVSTPGGTTIAVSPNIGANQGVPTVNGGGVTVSAPVGNSGASVGGGISSTPNGNAVGVGGTISFP